MSSDDNLKKYLKIFGSSQINFYICSDKLSSAIAEEPYLP